MFIKVFFFLTFEKKQDVYVKKIQLRKVFSKFQLFPKHFKIIVFHPQVPINN